jgi:hypothetical protein
MERVSVVAIGAGVSESVAGGGMDECEASGGGCRTRSK